MIMPEQRRLAGAVGTDEADLLALVERRGGLDEEDLVAVLLADIVETDHMRLGPGITFGGTLRPWGAPTEERTEYSQKMRDCRGPLVGYLGRRALGR